MDESLDDECVHGGDAARLVVFGAENRSRADALERHRRTDGDRPQPMRVENDCLAILRRRQERRVLLADELARLVALAGRDSDVGAGEESAEAAAFERRLNDPET